MTTVSAPPTVRSRVGDLATAQITGWQEGYLKDRPRDVAVLARLRRGAGREPGALPDLWTLVDTGSLHARLDEVRPLAEAELVRAENALHTALTLWALHQQSRGVRMHRPHSPQRPAGLGAAVRRLMPASDIDEPVRKRLVRAGTAPDLTSLSQRLRDLIVLLRRQDVPLDYGLLAGQLYAWQAPGGGDLVRREWGRSFHSWQPPAAQPGNSRDSADDRARTPDSDKDAS
ncbi:type I-E CRISPR-associated protein Cse2/CasB [Streptomyces sp. NPDC006259]|uniref:type I-E CRISPR-associated protein Cse2/CasB n=1 Tax=Streptomyces sp. NPDC006259 TaxID=3364740 RepID=UPI003695B9FD